MNRRDRPPRGGARRPARHQAIRVDNADAARMLGRAGRLTGTGSILPRRRRVHRRGVGRWLKWLGRSVGVTMLWVVRLSFGVWQTVRARCAERAPAQWPAASAAASSIQPPAAPTTRRGSRRLRWWLWGGATSGVLGVCLWPAVLSGVEFSRAQIWGVDRATVIQAVSGYVQHGRYPAALAISTNEGDYVSRMHYTLDADLQAVAEALLDQYRPDYGAVVALEPGTGRVLAMASGTRSGVKVGNLALRATFPSASVFKIVTAAASIDTGKVGPATVMPFNGATTTLYRKNVLKFKENKYTRHPTLREAFGKSINSVFARLGVFYLGGDTLEHYAERFGFNRDIRSDFTFPSSAIRVDPGDPWSIAETASGFTRGNTISPVHGAMLAAAIVNDGVMHAPYLVESVTSEYGVPLYTHAPDPGVRVVQPKTAREMRSLMRETVEHGTARRYFHRFFTGALADLDVGGKTGTLTGFKPRGRYDWFVGYGDLAGKRIAVAALCINIDKWYVKSSYLSRKMLEAYFGS